MPAFLKLISTGLNTSTDVAIRGRLHLILLFEKNLSTLPVWRAFDAVTLDNSLTETLLRVLLFYVDEHRDELLTNHFASSVFELDPVVVRNTRIVDEWQEFESQSPLLAVENALHELLDQFRIRRNVLNTVVIHRKLSIERERSIRFVI